MEALTKSIMNKILKDRVKYVKDNSNRDWDYTEMVKELFQLNMEDD